MAKGRGMAIGMKNFAKGVYNGASAGKVAGARMSRAGGHVGDFVGGGIRGTVQSYKAANKGMSGLGSAIKQGHMVNDKLSAKRVAGTFVATSLAGRVASGGGLYRDRYGNANLPGVPFL